MKKIYYLCLSALVLSSCSEDDYSSFDVSDPYIYILNEGSWGEGNSDISYVNLKEEVYNSMFETTNGRTLGDTGQSISIMGDNFYIPMRSSGKIEVMEYSSYSEVATIEAPDGETISPGYVQYISGVEAIMSDMWSNNMAIIDVSAHEITGFFDVGAGTGTMIAASDYVYVAKYNETSWCYDNIMILNPTTKTVVGEIETTGMAETDLLGDTNGMIWAMTATEFICIDPSTNTITKQIALPSEVQYNNYNSDCCIASDYRTIIFSATIGQDESTYTGGECKVYSFDIDDSSIGDAIFTASDVTTAYNIEISPDNEICIADAVDYSQSGILHIYSMSGVKSREFTVGVCPNFMVFVDYDLY